MLIFIYFFSSIFSSELFFTEYKFDLSYGISKLGKGRVGIGVEGVAESVDKLKFGAQLEERQIEVAAQAHLHREIISLQPEIIAVLTRKIEHRNDASHEVRTVIVEAWSGEYQVARRGDIRRLHVLTRLLGLAIGVQSTWLGLHGTGNSC